MNRAYLLPLTVALLFGPICVGVTVGRSVSAACADRESFAQTVERASPVAHVALSTAARVAEPIQLELAYTAAHVDRVARGTVRFATQALDTARSYSEELL